MREPETYARAERDADLARWREREKTALDLLQVAGELRFDRGVDLVLFRQQVYDTRPSELLRAHTRGDAYTKRPVDVDLTLSIAYAVAELEELRAAKIDIGRLAAEWIADSGGYANVDGFVRDRLRPHVVRAALAADAEQIDAGAGLHAPRGGRDVVLFGFGRIGRQLTRHLAAQMGRGDQLRLRAVVVRPKLADRHLELTKRAALLASDSVHGQFHGMVEVAPDGSALVVNGNRVDVIAADRPDGVDYEAYGIQDALLVDNTGVWRTREGLEQHLRLGIRSVLLTAPARDVPNIVVGINDERYDWSQVRLASAASCTTNGVAPVMKVLHAGFGIERAHIETVHAYTSDQNLLDNFHRKPRRGRAAPLNMVLTSTGAAEAVARVIPELDGRLTGNAVRVPVPNASLAILQVTFPQPTNRDEVNEVVRKASLRGPLCEQILFSESREFVSSNVVGRASTSIFDAPSTRVSTDGLSATVYVWYDNEYGYTCQVMRLAKRMAGVHRQRYI